MTTDLDGHLTKVSANFTARSMVALDAAAEITGDNHTVCLNRAVQAYAFLVKTFADGGKVEIVNPATGERNELELL